MFSRRSSGANMRTAVGWGELREHFIVDRKMIADTRLASGFGEFLLRGPDLN
jgi:hypothetical protein